MKSDLEVEFYDFFFFCTHVWDVQIWFST